MNPKPLPEKCLLFFFRDPASPDSIPLPLPSRKLWHMGLAMGVFFVVMASIAGIQIAGLFGHKIQSIFDLTTFLFRVFWILGWMTGVLFLGALTVLLLFYRESARIQDHCLFRIFSLGPLCLRSEYDLAKIRNLRLETIGGHPDNSVRLRFDYDQGAEELGDEMPRAQAEQIAAVVETEIKQPKTNRLSRKGPSGIDLLRWAEKFRPSKTSEALSPKETLVSAAAPSPHPFPSLSDMALMAANMLPLAGVFFFHWSLSDIMVLFWAESAVIGFYNVLKIAVVGKWIAIFSAPFFIGHYGGFMAAHFLFLYGFFIRGMSAQGPDLPVMEALSGIFVPLWPALLALFISHGISFTVHFLKEKERDALTVQKLMSDPYRRVLVMHLTIIFGGWLILFFKTPTPALIVLVLLKTAVDLRAHRSERKRAGG